jgi:glucose/arabinose dehydrogenase
MYCRPAGLGLVAALTVVWGVAGASWAGDADVAATLETIAPFDFPVYATYSPDDPTRIFVVERAGVIRILTERGTNDTPFLDISAQVVGNSGERGLLGLAFHPLYASNGYFYVNYTNTKLETVIARFQRSADPDLADPKSELEILTVPQLSGFHNAGWLDFGPDGYLYIALGDGGEDLNNAQDLSELYGKLLRIDIDRDPPFAVPPDNPFVGTEFCEEIWAYGLRNPWRCSFDRLTGDLWIGDVGNLAWEEVNFQPASSTGGENYGWPCMEGSHCFVNVPGCTCAGQDLVDPVYDYFHEPGFGAVMGGFVYRGSDIPNLQGKYVFSDLYYGELMALDTVTYQVENIMVGAGIVHSWGHDFAGELYVVGPDGLRKLVHVPDCNNNGIDDVTELADQLSPDCNANQLPDACDIALLNSLDMNGNSVPDECENDCNLNGIDDAIDIAKGTSSDCNANSIPDECDLAGGALDCNGNDILDTCDIVSGKGTDDDGSGVLDQCEQLGDFNGDGAVTPIDLGTLLANWGQCTCPQDVNDDGSVGPFDLGTLLANWG